MLEQAETLKSTVNEVLQSQDWGNAAVDNVILCSIWKKRP